MTHVTCRLTAKNRDHLRNPVLGSRVRATFTFFCQHRAFELLVWKSHLQMTYYVLEGHLTMLVSQSRADMHSIVCLMLVYVEYSQTSLSGYLLSVNTLKWISLAWSHLDTM